MRRVCALTLLCMLSPCLPAQPKQAPQQKILTFTHITVIDATGAPAKPDMTVVIKGDRISALGKTGRVNIPWGARVVDGSGKFLIPGLWDMHMHLSLVTDIAFPVLIANGVTGVCDMGGDLDQIDKWRKEIAGGAVLGPRIIRAGPIVDGPRTEEGKYRLTVTNEAEGRRAVQSLKQRGVDFVKVYHFLSRESYFAIADEAEKQGIPLAGHIPNGVSPAEASDTGQRSVEHTTVLIQSVISLADKRGRTQRQLTLDALDTLNGEKGAAFYRRFVKNGTWHTPTLVVAQSFLLRPELAAKSDPRRKYVAASAKQHWDKHNPVPQNVSAEEMADRERSLQRILELVGTMRRAGVPMLAGTDPPTRDVFPGFSLHDEFGLLVRAGLTPMEAIQAATINPAKCLGLLDSYGTIEKGKVADLVLLEADPLADISNTQKIAAVVVGGRLVPKASLQEMLDKVEVIANQR